MPGGPSAIDLDLPLHVSSTQLEAELWRFLQQNWAQAVADASIVKEYVLTSDLVDISHAFELVTLNYAHNVDKGAVVHGPVLALVHVLLARNDYHGCFKVIDVTYNSDSLQQLAKERLYRRFTWGAMASLAFGAVQYLSMPLLPPLALLALDLGTVLGTLYALLGVVHPKSLGRISWRPHTSFLYRATHGDEILVINKVVSYFEENNEVNVKNFHISQVRNVSSLSNFHLNDFEVQLPETTAVAFNSLDRDERVESLARYFRTQLGQRKLVWNQLKEEQMLLEFWLTHGENFQWVEPDQDPAEMVHFRDRQSN